MQEEFFCQHPTDELLICISDGCRDNTIKPIVCSKCCFVTHNHGVMNFAKLTPFEKHCYKVAPLMNKKLEIEESLKSKFRTIKEQIIEELNQKEMHLLNKLNEILPQSVETVVKQAFVKNEMMDIMMDEALKVMYGVNDVQRVLEQLNRCFEEVNQFGIDTCPLINNNQKQILDNLIQTEMIPQGEEHKNSEKPLEVKTENRQNTQFMRTKVTNGRVQDKNNAQLIISLDDLQDVYNIPSQIIGTFSSVCHSLKSNSYFTNIKLTINSFQKQLNPEDSDEQDLSNLMKIKFFNDLAMMHALEKLIVVVNLNQKFSLQDLMYLEKKLLTLENLETFKVVYHAQSEEALNYDFYELEKRLGSGKLNVDAKPIQ